MPIYSELPYLQYTDGDGTVHYFAKDGDDWKDEDGLGLKATEYSTGSFRITDDSGNHMDFSGGYLSLLRDANGNEMVRPPTALTAVGRGCPSASLLRQPEATPSAWSQTA